MASRTNRRVVLAARPKGEPKDTDFRLEKVEVPTPGPDQVLVRTLYLSLDPYMRGRMNAARSYAAPVELNHVMQGATVGEVVESNAPGWIVGDVVLGASGWQEYAVADASQLERLDPTSAPISTALGVLGMPGMTAYTGLLTIGDPKPGETVVVSAAAGAVGSAVGQIARLRGARAVGIAGGSEKCEYVCEELGFDACLDHRDPDLATRLADACPSGIDVYFENVGGAVLKAVLPLVNNFARIPVCGLISQYNSSAPPAGPDWSGILMGLALVRRLTIRGFIVTDFMDQRGQFLTEMSAWVRAGRLKYREHIVDGLENAVPAFQGLLRGANFGKLLVRVAR